MNNIKHLLVGKKSVNDIDKDVNLNINLSSSGKLLPPNEILKIVDVGEQFNSERQDSKLYRILGTINPLISNVLFNTSGPFSWEYLSNPLFLTQSGTTYAQSIKNNLLEEDGWFGYFNPIKSDSALCNFFDMEPKRERFDFVPDVSNNNVKNWELTITYPYSADTSHNMIKGGLLMVDAIPVTIGTRDMTALSTPVKHNLNAGNIVRILGTTLNGDFEVVRTGLDDGSLQDYYFCIDVNQTLLTVGPDSRMIKIVSGNESSYYFRKFKKVKTRVNSKVESDDYEIYNLGFSENIFTDSVTQFVFNEDIDVSGLVDNLGRPLSDLFLTIVKTDGNGMMTNISSGIEAPQLSILNTSVINEYLKNIPVIQKIHNVITKPTHKSLDTNVNIDDDDFYGDVVEYNKYEVKETVLGDVYHRFNTINREGAGSIVAFGPREEGYYYKAHQQIKIRQYSSYIEQGDNKTDNKPDYSIDLGDGRYLWRDLLNIGFNDNKDESLNYPFLNGVHYMYDTYIFNVNRQDQFDFWDLYHADFPSDPIGNTMSNKFKVNKTNDIC